MMTVAEYVAVLEREFKSADSADYKNEGSDQILNTRNPCIIKKGALTESAVHGRTFTSCWMLQHPLWVQT